MISRLDYETFKKTVIRWMKFNFVGAVGIVVQLMALAILKSGMELDYMVATGLAVEVAVLHNFIWHERYTWLDRRSGGTRAILGRLARFNLSTGLISIVGNLAIMRMLVGHLHFHYMFANMVAIGTCSLANFLVSDQLVFRKLNPEG